MNSKMVLCNLKYLCSRSRGVSAQRRAKAVGIDCAVLIILHLIEILIVLYLIEMLDHRMTKKSCLIVRSKLTKGL